MVHRDRIFYTSCGHFFCFTFYAVYVEESITHYTLLNQQIIRWTLPRTCDFSIIFTKAQVNTRHLNSVWGILSIWYSTISLPIEIQCGKLCNFVEDRGRYRVWFEIPFFSLEAMPELITHFICMFSKHFFPFFGRLVFFFCLRLNVLVSIVYTFPNEYV